MEDFPDVSILLSMLFERTQYDQILLSYSLLLRSDTIAVTWGLFYILHRYTSLCVGISAFLLPFFSHDRPSHSIHPLHSGQWGRKKSGKKLCALLFSIQIWWNAKNCTLHTAHRIFQFRGFFSSLPADILLCKPCWIAAHTRFGQANIYTLRHVWKHIIQSYTHS